MEFIETHDLKKIHFLKSQSFEQLKPIFKKCKNEKERREQYCNIQSFCNAIIKCRGKIKRTYAYSLNTPLEFGGRLYCGSSVQSLHKQIRGFLMTHTTDIDMKNCHPVLLSYICKLHNIDCPNLDFYINNRDEILSRSIDREKAKETFLKAINDDKINTKETNQFFKDFDKEMKKLQTSITNLDEYKDITSSVPSQRTYNWNGSALNRILCMYENKVLQIALSHCIKQQIIICSPMFDGFMIYGNYYENRELLQTITDECEREFPNLNVQWDYKPHFTIIDMPEDYEIPTEIPQKKLTKTEENKQEIKRLEESNSGSYRDFEYNYKDPRNPNQIIGHFKILNLGIYGISVNNKVLLKTRDQMTIIYEHLPKLSFWDNDKEKFIDKSFIFEWFKDEDIRRYDDIGIYPNTELCPSNIFNMWKPFQIQLLDRTNYIYKPKAVQFILNHFYLLFDKNVQLVEYYIKWLAHIFCFPEIKPICCPVIIGKQGSGKTSIMKINEKMIGKEKYYETANVDDVFGHFNEAIADKFFVNLNELSKKDIMGVMGKFKAGTSDYNMTINKKGLSKYEITSYHRYCITSNGKEPIPTERDDRRCLFIPCSNILIGNNKHFNKFYKFLDDNDAILSFYDYLMNYRDDVKNFNDLNLPITEYQTNIQDANMTYPELFLRHFTNTFYDQVEVIKMGTEILDLFNEWKIENGIENYSTNTIKLGKDISNLKIDGITNKHTRKGNGKCYNISLLKSHFKII
jgi:hypothetical protein